MPNLVYTSMSQDVNKTHMSQEQLTEISEKT